MRRTLAGVGSCSARELWKSRGHRNDRRFRHKPSALRFNSHSRWSTWSLMPSRYWDHRNIMSAAPTVRRDPRRSSAVAQSSRFFS